MAKHLGDPRPLSLSRRQRWLGGTYLGVLSIVLVTVTAVLHGITQRSPGAWAEEISPAASQRHDTQHASQRTSGTSRDSDRSDKSVYRVVAGQTLSLRPVVVAARRMAHTPTEFRVSTFNLLGASHTARGGNDRGYASGASRMHGAVSLLTQYGVDVVGFQEMEPVQYNTFMALTGHRWGAYPALTLDPGSVRQSIAWSLDDWTLVRAESVAIPYFHGQLIRMPYVLLRNNASGEDVWFANFHNPASTPAHGNNQFWRTVAETKEIALVHQLEASSDAPVVITGDMNEREEYFSRLAGGTDLCPANALVTIPGVCSAPSHMDIDWIFGSPQITFSDYVSNQDALVRHTSDHPIVVASGRMAPAASRHR